MRWPALVITLLAASIAMLWPWQTVSGETCHGNGSDAADGFQLSMLCATPPTNDPQGLPTASAGAGSTSPYREYRWASVCVPFDPQRSTAAPPDCSAARHCSDAAERVWQLWAQYAPPRSGWALLASRCFGRLAPPPAQTPKPQVTPGLVLNALREMGLPALRAHTQPEDKTLVNFATIFYARPHSFVRTITLLGQQVHVEATPTSFAWHYGDGSSTTTSTPGAPYPAKDITHNYADAHVTVQTSVDVTYSARFQVGGGGWQDIPETVTIAGPASALRISEATALLSGDYH
jgi:hypothetical protein